MLLNKPLPDPNHKKAPAASSGESSSSGSSHAATTAPATVKPTPSATPSFANSDDMLRWLYADLTRISQVASADLHEEGLVAAAGGTLAMDVDRVSTNAYFGSVMGTLRARSTNTNIPDLAVPFCGVWRFDDRGRLAEHWENVSADQDKVARWFDEARQ
ncbi:hypothetical protein PG999_010417 [Apiospora kogelbergensis]|uniref:SnoaL-like domain-containing protein n=1 Tax=Apiospora kogelbergensis TaxID=1337665 RepID=A0AAW0QFQ6_9PEZI